MSVAQPGAEETQQHTHALRPQSTIFFFKDMIMLTTHGPPPAQAFHICYHGCVSKHKFTKYEKQP